MSANSNSNRNHPYNFSDFSLRRLLLQGARAARGSPQLGGTRLCDVERGGGSSSEARAAATAAGARLGSAVAGTSAASASGSVGPTVTVHASGSASGSHRSTGDDGASQHSSGAAGVSPSAGGCSTGCGSLAPQSPHKLAAASGTGTVECPLCCIKCAPDDFFVLLQCKHFACRVCLVRYLKIEILESRTDIACAECAQSMHPSDIHALLVHNPATIRKYEDFMVRRVLLADPDSRWCPAPDCSYAVIASGCASCPRIKCERPGCDINFCYHCKAEWHPDQTCDAARASRHSPISVPSGGSLSQDAQHRDDIKPCPRCQVLIVKMDDGSCNHMVCAVCGSEFCWLCMKVISDLHYLSPSGCTFWGKKPWSRKKKLMWQLGTLVGAPVGIALVAGIAVPAMIIGIPVWVGRKVHTRYKDVGKHKRNCAVLSGVLASVLVSPVLAGLAVAIGVPILLFYVYGVVPVSLCRAGCGVSTTRDGFKFDFDEEGGNAARHQTDAASSDAVSRLGATSIGEVSLSVASGSHLPAAVHQQQQLQQQLGGSAGAGTSGSVGGSLAPGCSATAGTTSVSNVSTAALAGSLASHRLEVAADVSNSETASAVTCVSEKSANAPNDTASTKALAGSLLNYRQALDASNLSEDGNSERVRFDNICYVIDGRKTGSDQELSADKASVGSCRSFRSSDRSFRDDVGDSASLSSLHKRILNVQQRLAKTQQQSAQRTSSQHCNATSAAAAATAASSSAAPVTTVAAEPQCSDAAGRATAAAQSSDSLSVPCTPTQSAHGSPTSQSSFVSSSGGGGSGGGGAASSASPTPKSLNTKNMSKVAILRNLFFSQHPDGDSGEPDRSTKN